VKKDLLLAARQRRRDIFAFCDFLSLVAEALKGNCPRITGYGGSGLARPIARRRRAAATAIVSQPGDGGGQPPRLSEMRLNFAGKGPPYNSYELANGALAHNSLKRPSPPAQLRSGQKPFALPTEKDRRSQGGASLLRWPLKNLRYLFTGRSPHPRKISVPPRVVVYSSSMKMASQSE
jgi:hypothetical protein